MTKYDRHTKIFISAIIFIPLAMILFCIGTSSSIKNTQKAVSGAVDRSLDADDANGEAAVSELKDIWQKHSHELVLFLNHDDVNGVELEIEEFSAAIIQGDREVAERSGAKIKCLLDMMAGKDKLTLRNLL
ncbi:MAG: DUF4363 family protein [Clostridia bacterium]|nr:DUF4363 family protein [Clostridia bacterium]